VFDVHTSKNLLVYESGKEFDKNFTYYLKTISSPILNPILNPILINL